MTAPLNNCYHSQAWLTTLTIQLRLDNISTLTPPSYKPSSSTMLYSTSRNSNPTTKWLQLCKQWLHNQATTTSSNSNFTIKWLQPYKTSDSATKWLWLLNQVTLILQAATSTLYPSDSDFAHSHSDSTSTQSTTVTLAYLTRLQGIPFAVTTAPRSTEQAYQPSDFTCFIEQTYQPAKTAYHHDLYQPTCTNHILWSYIKPTHELGQFLALPLHPAAILTTGHWNRHSTLPSKSMYNILTINVVQI